MKLEFRETPDPQTREVWDGEMMLGLARWRDAAVFIPRHNGWTLVITPPQLRAVADFLDAVIASKCVGGGTTNPEDTKNE